MFRRASGIGAAALAVIFAACSTFGVDLPPGEPAVEAGTDACTTCADAAGADAAPPRPADDGGSDPVVTVRAGAAFACALHRSGTVSCWGRNNERQAGQPPEGDLACDGDSKCRPTPLPVPGLTNVTQIAMGQAFGCALQSDGKVLCWGSTGLGSLGTPFDAVASRPPTLVAGLPPAIEVAAGVFNACARVKEDGGIAVYCWGTNREGMLGFAPAGSQAAPTRFDALAGATSVVLSRVSEHACAILANSSVVCWGNNFAGSLGHLERTSGDTDGCPGLGVCNQAPSIVMGVSAMELAVGYNFACARTAASDVACWGSNASGALGRGTADGDPHPEPATIAALQGASSIVAGGSHACALVMGRMHCWGGNAFGELGNGNASVMCGPYVCKAAPQVVEKLLAVERISAGLSASFARTAAGEWAWGANPDGRLGHTQGTAGDLLSCSTNPGRCNPTPQPLVIP